MKLSIKNVTHSFPENRQRYAVESFSCEIQAGQFVAIVGPSGCGKSTLLRLIANLLQPTLGNIVLDDKLPEQVAAERQIAWMSQSPALLPWLTVKENVALVKRFRPQSRQARLTPEQALEKVGLLDALDAYPSTLSGGMQQRLALARILIMEADLWLMDEPFAALDELTRERLTGELLTLWKPLQPTVLWVTHNIYEAIRLADRVLVMSPSPGKLVADIPVEMKYPRHESSLEFQNLLLELRKALGQMEFEGIGTA